MKTKKPTLGVYAFSGCSGCQIAVLNLEDSLVDLFEHFDIKYFHLIQGRNDMKCDVDVAIVEGVISTTKQRDELIEIRKKSKILLAMGSCACTGGIPAMRNEMKREEIRKIVYKDAKHIKSIPAQPAEKFVEVDGKIRGCPIDKKEFVDVILSLVTGRRRFDRNGPVCTECKINGNECLLELGQLCMGPITIMGCNSVCVNNNETCIACRGLFDDNRIEAYVKYLKEKGFKVAEIKDSFERYLSNEVDMKMLNKLLAK